MRILPGVLKELMKHVPTVLFDAVEWQVMVSEIPKLSRRVLQKEGFTELCQHHKIFLLPFHIELVDEVKKDFNLKHNQKAAHRILTLYFAQLFSSEGVFLDLRPHHFDMNETHLLWHPSGLWTKFSPEFREGLIDIYDGFYNDDDQLYQQGLIKIGVASSEWPSADLHKLAEMFKSQFGSSRTEMVFDLGHFKAALFKITDFLLKKKVTISKDFLYLGVYLVTLYSTLERTHVKVNVKKIYLEVRQQMNLKVEASPSLQ